MCVVVHGHQLLFGLTKLVDAGDVTKFHELTFCTQQRKHREHKKHKKWWGYLGRNKVLLYTTWLSVYVLNRLCNEMMI
jgi:hypothetical protein